MSNINSVCLVMIVRNEAKVIRRCLNSVKPYISSWVISDTGSTDGTDAVILETLGDIPGELSRANWVDFSFNRNLALERATGRADFLLLIDADMVLNASDDFRSRLENDAYFVPFTGDLDYATLRLVSTRLQWKYQGAVHEVIECDTSYKAARLDGVSMTHFEDGSARSDKWEREVRVLTQELVEQPNNSRTVFYLAQSYRALGEFEKAAELYERRAGMGGWPEEAWYALYQLGRLQFLLNEDKRTAIFTLLQAYQVRPTRLEPLLPIVQFYNSHRQFNLAYLFANRWTEVSYPDDILFVERPVYETLLPYEYALSGIHTRRMDEAARVMQQLKREARIAPEQLAVLESQICSTKPAEPESFPLER